MGFAAGLDGKASARNAGDLGSIPGLERSPGEGDGTPLQYSCLENPTDGGLQSMGRRESDTTEGLHFLLSVITRFYLDVTSSRFHFSKQYIGLFFLFLA